MGLVIDHQLPAVILWPLLFVSMIVLSVMLARPFRIVCEVESTRAIALMILETAGASVALALAPRCVVGVFHDHVFCQAMFKVDCHCVTLFVSHACIIP